MADKLRKNEVAAVPSEFRKYFDQHVVPLFRANVEAGRVGWTNNNCESMNHVLKQAVQWRPQQLPDLLEKLRQLVVGQHMEADRALIGRGDFMLMPTHAKHCLTLDKWKAMSATQRSKASDSCFQQGPVPASTSSDGSVTVPTTPGAGRKPCGKRPRADRTVTNKRARAQLIDSDTDTSD